MLKINQITDPNSVPTTIGITDVNLNLNNYGYDNIRMDQDLL